MDDVRPAAGARYEPEALVLLALVALFVALYLPSLGDLAKYHGDERFYTDAAIRMVQTGAYATPVYPDGQPRFNKPLLTYWLVAASFRLFGIGTVASRLPFLLAGCVLSLLTWRLARHLLDDRATALLAAAIVLANPQLSVLATRATPDILVALFIALSFHGFARLIVRGERRGSAYAAAWMGAGLAVATKGVPGLVALAYCIAFLALWPGSPLPLRALFHLPSMLMGGALAVLGIGTPYLRYGRRALDTLYIDQVGARPFVTSIGAVVENLTSYLWGTAVNMLPWTLLLVLVVAINRGLVRRTTARGRILYALGVGWWLALVVVFATHDFMRLRYVAPAYPMLALVIAAAFAEAVRVHTTDRVLRVAVGVLLLALALLGVLVTIAGAAVDHRLVYAGMLWAAAGSAWLWARHVPGLAPLVTLAGATMVAIAVGDSFVRPVFDASPVPALMTCLRTIAPHDLRGATIDRLPNLASKIRLASGGELDLAALPEPPDPASLDSQQVLIIPPSLAPRWQRRGDHLDRCGFDYAHWSAGDVWAVVVGRARERVFDRHRLYYLVDIRR